MAAPLDPTPIREPIADRATLTLPPVWVRWLEALRQAAAAAGAQPSTTLRYLWTTQTAGQPQDRHLGVNDADYALATEVRLTEETANQADASAVLNLLHSGDRVAIQDVADATRYMRYVLTADPVDLGVWRTCAVAYETGGGLTIGNNQEVLLLLRVEGPAPAQTAQLAGMAARLTALEARLEALER